MIDQIHHNDCFTELKNIKKSTIDLILTDPPYAISKDSNFKIYSDKASDTVVGKYSKHTIHFGEWDTEEVDLDRLFGEYYRVLKTGGTLIIFYDIWKSNIIKSIASKYKFNQHRIGQWVKCISGSSEIYVRNKIKEHKKINIKDLHRHGNLYDIEVWTGTNWVKILNVVLSNNNKQKVKITLGSGEEIKSTIDHTFVLECGKEIEAIDLKLGDSLKKTKLPETDIDKSKMMSDLMSWFIGLYLAEGSMSNNKMQISSNISEEERIAKINKLCDEYDGKFHIFRKEGTMSMTINVSSPIIQSYVNKYISGKDSYTKRLSNSFWNLPNSKIKICLLSYLESDAHYDSKNNRYKVGFTGKNRQLERDIRTMCSKLEYRCSIRLSKIKNIKTGKRHSVLRGSIYLNEKFKKNMQSIVDISKINDGKSNYYDIILQGDDNTFSLYSGTILHNCNPTPINSNVNYLSNANEFFFSFVKGKKPTFNSKYDNGIYEYPICHGKERIHPTQKPKSLIKELILKHSNPGDTVLDTFSGSGVVAESCILTDRHFICIEKSELYYNMSMERIAKLR